jgi:S-adenosylmethionine decarboxylase proenzyme
VVAGPNGSGKTSLTDFLKSQDYDFGVYINPDDIANELTGTYDERVRQAQALADDRRKKEISLGRSFSFETVFSHPSKLNELEAARKAGFEITLFFVGVDRPEINIERVRARVQLGGHDVPEDRVVARYARTMGLLADIVERADRAVIFDNTVQSNDLLAFHGRVVAECVANGNRIVITTRSLVPAWTLRYLVGPARYRGWIINNLPARPERRQVSRRFAVTPSEPISEHFTVRNGVQCAGAHLVVDLHGAKGLDDVEHIEAVLRRCIEVAHSTLLCISCHDVDGHGISAMAVLAEGHISIHTWPDVGFAALDVFLGGKANPDSCIPVLRDAFKARRVGVSELLRGQDA